MKNGYHICLAAACALIGLVFSACGGKDEVVEQPVVAEEPLPEIGEPSLGIAVVDLERIYLGFHKTKAAQAEVDANIAAARQVGRPLLGELNWLRQKMADPATNSVEAADLKLRVEELRKKLDEMTKAAPPLEIPEDRKQMILTELSQLVGEFVKAKGFSVVLNQSAGGKYGSVTFPLGNLPDLTDHVIEHLRQR